MGNLTDENRMEKYGKKCRTCFYWRAPWRADRKKLSEIHGWDDDALDKYDYTTGRCIKNSIHDSPDPEVVWENGTSSNDDKSCASWEVLPFLKYEYNQYLEKKEKETKEQIEKELKLKNEENELIKAAGQGNMEAQFQLGNFYYDHFNNDSASLWFKKAADQGHIEAGKKLALINKIKTITKRNKVIRSIIGSFIGIILGVSLSLFMAKPFPDINVIRIIVCAVVGMVSGVFVGMLALDMSSIIFGALILGIPFSITTGIFIGGYGIGVLITDLFFGAVAGLVIGICCTKLN